MCVETSRNRIVVSTAGDADVVSVEVVSVDGGVLRVDCTMGDENCSRMLLKYSGNPSIGGSTQTKKELFKPSS